MAELAETMDQAVKVMGERVGKYLSFSLAEEEYGIGILKIKEIIGMLPITSVPPGTGFCEGFLDPKCIDTDHRETSRMIKPLPCGSPGP